MLSSVSDKFYFSANDEVHGQELWVTDGTVAGTRLIDVVPGAGDSNPSSVTDIKGVAYFKADASLWRTNGTTARELLRSPTWSQLNSLNSTIGFTLQDFIPNMVLNCSK